MNSFSTTLTGLFLIYVTILTTVYCIDLQGVDLTKDELIALTRDHFGRQDPDALLNGFFPVWAVIQFLIACSFFIVAIVSGLCYILGCRTPPEQHSKRVK